MAALRAVGGVRGRLGPSPRGPSPRGQRRGGAWGALLSRWGPQELGERLRRQRLRRLNQPNPALREALGDDAAAASFGLALGGAVRFQGQDWLRGGSRPLPPELLRLPLLGLDLGGTSLTYRGFDYLVPLRHLQLLDLSHCPEVDDWALGRLQALGGSLQELSLAGCPLVTERGLATLHHLRLLRRLDLSHLPLPSPGLLRILLEEMLPRCHILGLPHPPLAPPPPRRGHPPPPPPRGDPSPKD